MKKKQRYLILIFIFLTLVILSAYIYNVNRITNQLINENIEVQVKQCEQYISNNLKHTMSLLESISKTITVKNPELLLSEINKYVENYTLSGDFEYINFINSEGILYHFDGTTENVREMQGFKNAMEGQSTVSHSMYNDKREEEMIFYTVPVYGENEVAGALSAVRYTDKVANELMDEFGTKDFVGVVVSLDGDFVLYSKPAIEMKTGKTLFEDLEKDRAIRKSEYKQIKLDFAMGKSGIIHLKHITNGYIAYEKVSESNDWYFLCYVRPNNFQIYSNTTILFSIIALVAILIIVLAMTLLIFYQEKKKIKEIEETEHTDKLTGIPNENGFQQRVAEYLKRDENTSYAMVFMDVDNFKFINHNYSYRLGDEILRSLAQYLDRLVENQGIVARISSDSFALFIVYEDDLIKQLHQGLFNEINEEYGESIAKMIHFPIGYYMVTKRDEKIRFMMDKASYAWKYAKVHKMTGAKEYDDEIMQYEIKLKRIENNQQYALEHGEFKVYLQPKVDLKTNRVIGAEALVRWVSKFGGFMPPDDFIPIFENNGFVKEVDFYVLERACAYIREKLDAGEIPINISINQSRITMMDEFYMNRLECVLKKYNVPKQYIDLEVTESLFIGNYNAIIEILKKVKSMGILISMDDFGSGYSSLNLLKEMPIDNLKIDKVFLDESATSSQSRIIIKSVIEMAKNLNMAVVCEGVETREQVEFLKEMHCDVAQGYYYDRPVEIHVFDEKIKNRAYIFS